VGPPRAPLPARQSLAGTRLGAWILDERIGVGGFGDVYRARHATIAGKLAAVKVLTDPTLGAQVQRACLAQEAMAATRARHAHTIDIYDCGSDGPHSYLVMELLEGETLRQRLGRAHGRLGTVEAVRIATQVAAALRAAHANQVAHLDLKPENIFLVRRDGELAFIKLLDFGIARVIGQRPPGDVPQALGTPGYMAPEQWRQEPFDGRADVYALGVVLHEMLVGRLPHERWERAPREPRTQAREWLHANEPGLAALIESMLAPPRERRPGDMATVVQRLADAARMAC
jgi:serine/threonine-protein kinase